MVDKLSTLVKTTTAKIIMRKVMLLLSTLSREGGCIHILETLSSSSYRFYQNYSWEQVHVTV